ncbi:olfactomedin-4 [Suncus etruscus]|uniref:olfactomedin-4 n=1 Tax=Suncus etruscus TaxID=109475 RepID=UPI00210F92AB|nr:olfactomedin-4 [Suncus etruscus]
MGNSRDLKMQISSPSSHSYPPTALLPKANFTPRSSSNKSRSSADFVSESQWFSNFTGSLDEHRTCQCSVILPDTNFPVERVEYLEIIAQNLTMKFEIELSKVKEYAELIRVYEEKLSNLTLRVENMEKDTISYTELDFELIKLEVKEMEKLIIEMKNTFIGSSTIIEQLESEIRNMTLLVEELETLDKNNVLAIRREILALKKKLKDCEASQNASDSNHQLRPPPPPGSCGHGAVANISDPHVVRINWRGYQYKYGAWGREYSPQNPDKGLYWETPLETNARYFMYYRLYQTFNDLLVYKYSHQYEVTYGQGAGTIVYNNTMYINWYNTPNIASVNLTTNKVSLNKPLPNAVFNNRFSYANVAWQDMDFAVDEFGFWVIYSTEYAAGNIVISKLNDTTLEVLNTWHSQQFKPSVSNTFMVCGTLYATRIVNTTMEEIFYYYDTNTGKEGQMSIMMGKAMSTVQSINYHPFDHKLYVYNDGYLLNFDLSFYPETF